MNSSSAGFSRIDGGHNGKLCAVWVAASSQASRLLLGRKMDASSGSVGSVCVTIRASNGTAEHEVGSGPQRRFREALNAQIPLRFGKTFLAKGTDRGKLLNLLDHSCLRRGLKLRIHRKREDFQSDFFGDREVTLFETECFVGLL
jgi:hypothetical protein